MIVKTCILYFCGEYCLPIKPPKFYVGYIITKGHYLWTSRFLISLLFLSISLSVYRASFPNINTHGPYKISEFDYFSSLILYFFILFLFLSFIFSFPLILSSLFSFFLSFFRSVPSFPFSFFISREGRMNTEMSSVAFSYFTLTSIFFQQVKIFSKSFVHSFNYSLSLSSNILIPVVL